MTKEEMAALLNGREMGNEITEREESMAEANGLVVLFGYSDDNAEFRGAIHEEVSAIEDTVLLVTPKEARHQEEYHRCHCDHCGYKKFESSAKKIKAIWCDRGYSWIYETDIPHATFDIMEDGEKFCRGIVFEIASCQ